jgi:GT2 family glycosyltransferase
MPVECVYVIDNGRDANQLLAAVEAWPGEVYIHAPDRPLGVAESWNWFLKNVPEERIITNDDIIFAPHSIERMVSSPEECVVAIQGAAFSCFLLRDSCVEKVGFFDEEISPGYGYFEDCDYNERMKLAGTTHHPVDAGVEHMHSGTLKAANASEMAEHHRKFIIAQENFIRKWGRMPVGKVRQYA